MNNDKKYMQMAIKLAKKAEGKTSPNPLVGAVIVKNNRIIGIGYHKKAGMPHAEINALKLAGNNARGAALYVNLEPCDHFGKTPPCTNAIIRSGIKKVIIGMKDPNPLNNGRGIKKLKRYGIKVITRILEKEAESINRPYVKFITKKMPYITVKVAQSLDGKIATKTGDSKWISSEDSRRYVHKLRAGADAVMVGANTILRDDPELLSRLSGSRQPIRVVVDGRRRIPPASRIFSNSKYPVILASSVCGGNEALRPEGRHSHSSRANPAPILLRRDKRAGLVGLMRALAKQGITNIIVEGGWELIADLIEKRLVDKLLIFIAPKVIGGRDAITAVEGSGCARIKDTLNFNITAVRHFKKDILIEAEK